MTAGARIVSARTSRGPCTRSRTTDCPLGTITGSSSASVELAVRPTRCGAFTVHASATGYNRHSGEYTGNYELRPFQDQTLDTLLNRGRPVSDFFAVS